MQFGCAYMLHIQTNRVVRWLLGLAAVLGFLGTEVGKYWTLALPLRTADGLSAETYTAAEIMSFLQYANLVLDKSLGTVVSNVVGSFVGDYAILWYAARTYPYCIPCSRYKKRHGEFVIEFTESDKLLQTVVDRIKAAFQAAKYEKILDCLYELCETHNEMNGDVKVTVHQRFCPQCRAISFVVRGKRRTGKKGDWKDIDEIEMTHDTEPGAHPWDA